MDTKQKHTQGPWDIVRLAHCSAIQAGPDNRICTLWDHVSLNGEPCGSIESQNKTQAEIDANARLIAAAPALLAACKAMYLACARDDVRRLLKSEYDTAFGIARAAIAQAEKD